MDYVGKFAIKLNRAATMSAWGNYPATFQAQIDHIPRFLRERLTASELAAVVDALKRSYDQGRADSAREVVKSGGIYDTTADRFRELVP
jgi:hypothetical protein